MMSAQRLIAFEERIKQRFERGEIRGPIHLSNGNEAQLIEIFRDVKKGDWCFSTWRNHYHALLHGLPEAWVDENIAQGNSMNMNSAAHRFYSSAIVGGCLPIATGVAGGIKRQGGTEHVWCFVGDMAASGGMFHDCVQYARGFNLPITFVVEDNGKSTTTPTAETWGPGKEPIDLFVTGYQYESAFPHVGLGRRNTF